MGDDRGAGWCLKPAHNSIKTRSTWKPCIHTVRNSTPCPSIKTSLANFFQRFEKNIHNHYLFHKYRTLAVLSVLGPFDKVTLVDLVLQCSQ